MHLAERVDLVFSFAIIIFKRFNQLKSVKLSLRKHVLVKFSHRAFGPTTAHILIFSGQEELLVDEASIVRPYFTITFNISYPVMESVKNLINNFRGVSLAIQVKSISLIMQFK